MLALRSRKIVVRLGPAWATKFQDRDPFSNTHTHTAWRNKPDTVGSTCEVGEARAVHGQDQPALRGSFRGSQGYRVRLGHTASKTQPKQKGPPAPSGTNVCHNAPRGLYLSVAIGTNSLEFKMAVWMPGENRNCYLCPLSEIPNKTTQKCKSDTFTRINFKNNFEAGHGDTNL